MLVDVRLQDNEGSTALICACRKAHVSVVELLLQEDTVGVNICDGNGHTALMVAAASASSPSLASEAVTVVQLLLKVKSVEVNTRDKDGNTALMHAAMVGAEGVVRALLNGSNAAAGAERAVKDKTGQTALGLARTQGHEAVVQLLL